MLDFGVSFLLGVGGERVVGVLGSFGRCRSRGEDEFRVWSVGFVFDSVERVVGFVLMFLWDWLGVLFD